MALGSNINRPAAVAQLYQLTTRQHPDEVLERRVQRYEEFRRLPLKARIFRHITLRAPCRDDHDWSKHELAVRRGEAKPYWFVQEYIIDRRSGK